MVGAGRVDPREADDERRPSPELGLHGEGAAAGLDDPIDDRQSQARPRKVLRARRSVEWLEHAAGIVVRHPQAVVGDAQIVPVVDRDRRRSPPPGSRRDGGTSWRSPSGWPAPVAAAPRCTTRRRASRPRAAGPSRPRSAARNLPGSEPPPLAGSQVPRTCPSTRESVSRSSTSVSMRCTPRLSSSVGRACSGTSSESCSAARWMTMSGLRMSCATRPANASSSRFRSSSIRAPARSFLFVMGDPPRGPGPHRHDPGDGEQTGREERDHQPASDRRDRGQALRGAGVVDVDEPVEVLAHAGEQAGGHAPSPTGPRCRGSPGKTPRRARSDRRDPSGPSAPGSRRPARPGG